MNRRELLKAVPAVMALGVVGVSTATTEASDLREIFKDLEWSQPFLYFQAGPVERSIATPDGRLVYGVLRDMRCGTVSLYARRGWRIARGQWVKRGHALRVPEEQIEDVGCRGGREAIVANLVAQLSGLIEALPSAPVMLPGAEISYI